MASEKSTKPAAPVVSDEMRDARLRVALAILAPQDTTVTLRMADLRVGGFVDWAPREKGAHGGV